MFVYQRVDIDLKLLCSWLLQVTGLRHRCIAFLKKQTETKRCAYLELACKYNLPEIIEPCAWVFKSERKSEIRVEPVLDFVKGSQIHWNGYYASLLIRSPRVKYDAFFLESSCPQRTDRHDLRRAHIVEDGEHQEVCCKTRTTEHFAGSRE